MDESTWSLGFPQPALVFTNRRPKRNFHPSGKEKTNGMVASCGNFRAKNRRHKNSTWKLKVIRFRRWNTVHGGENDGILLMIAAYCSLINDRRRWGNRRVRNRRNWRCWRSLRCSILKWIFQMLKWRDFYGMIGIIIYYPRSEYTFNSHVVFKCLLNYFQ